MNSANTALISIHVAETGNISSAPIARVRIYPEHLRKIPAFSGPKPKSCSRDVLKAWIRHLSEGLREDIEFLIEYIEAIEKNLKKRLPSYTSIDFNLMRLPNNQVEWIAHIDSPYALPGLVVYQDDMGIHFSRDDKWLPDENKVQIADAIRALNDLIQPSFEEYFVQV